MTEPAHPIEDVDLTGKLRVVGDIKPLNYRPTEEFKQCVQDVIELRSKGMARGILVPLSQHLDSELNRRKIRQ